MFVVSQDDASSTLILNIVVHYLLNNNSLYFSFIKIYQAFLFQMVYDFVKSWVCCFYKTGIEALNELLINICMRLVYVEHKSLN